MMTWQAEAPGESKLLFHDTVKLGHQGTQDITNSCYIERFFISLRLDLP